MDDIFLFLKDNKDSVNIILTITSGVIGSIIGFFINNWWNRKKYLLDKQRLEHEIKLSRNKIEADKKSLRQQMITNNIAPMRQAWINDLKKSMATYISSTEHVIRYKENYKHDINDRDYLYFKENARKSDELYRYIELMLPEHDEIATTISSLLSKIQESLIEDNYSFEEIYNLLLDCSIETKKLLKKEWEVTKSLKEIE